MEPVALHRDPHRAEDRVELGLVQHLRVVQDRPDLAARVLQEREDAPPGLPQLARLPVDVDVALELPVPPEELERGIAEHLAQPVLDLRRRRQVGNAVDQGPDGVQGRADLGHGFGCSC